MNTINLVLLCLIVALVSCSKENEAYDITLENLKLSPETIEFFEFYEGKKQLVFKRNGLEQIRGESLEKYDTRNVTKSVGSNIGKDNWIFNKVGGTDVTYKYHKSGYNQNIIEGRVEERVIRYKDEEDHILEFKLINKSYPVMPNKAWNKLYEAFEIRYSSPCWTTLLRYKTVDYKQNNDNKFETMMHEYKVIDNVTYDDLMELSDTRDSAHYKVLASKSQGVVRIINQDRNQVWHLD